MQAREDAEHRITLAEEALVLARHDLEFQRWPVCVNFSQQAVENAAKAPLAFLGPAPRTHSPSDQLTKALQQGLFPDAMRAAVQRLAELNASLGSDVHMRVVYGDEQARLTPRQLFGEADARQALASAEEAVRLARQVLEAAG